MIVQSKSISDFLRMEEIGPIDDDRSGDVPAPWHGWIRANEMWNDPEWRAERSKQLSETAKRLHEAGVLKQEHMRSESFKDKQRAGVKAAKAAGKYSGKNNGQYGSFWITDGTKSKLIRSTEQIPSGWRKGRVMLAG